MYDASSSAPAAAASEPFAAKPLPPLALERREEDGFLGVPEANPFCLSKRSTRTCRVNPRAYSGCANGESEQSKRGNAALPFALLVAGVPRGYLDVSSDFHGEAAALDQGQTLDDSDADDQGHVLHLPVCTEEPPALPSPDHWMHAVLDQ